jgi:hypothetical protein
MNLRRFIISSSKLRPTARKGLHAYPRSSRFRRFALGNRRCGSGIKRRSWNRVCGNRRRNIKVIQDARIFRSIESGCENALRLVRPGTRDREVEAEGVVLGAVGLGCCMQSYDLVAQDIVSWSDGRRNLSDPGEVVRDHDVRYPGAVLGLRVQKRLSANYKPFQFGCVDCFARAITVCKHVCDGSFVGGGPGVPGNRNLGSPFRWCCDHCIGGISVADNVWVGVCCWSNKSII